MDEFAVDAAKTKNANAESGLLTVSIQLIETEKLKGHEQTDLKHLSELKNEIESDGVLKKPIIVDKSTSIVLDGHHRLQALKELGCKKIPVLFIDYSLPNIIVHAWRDGETVTKEMVTAAALSGKKMLPKTSRHMIETENGLEHISVIEKEVDIPLEDLE